MIQPCCTPGQKSLGHIKEQPLNAFLVQIHGEYILLSAFKWSFRQVLLLTCISMQFPEHDVNCCISSLMGCQSIVRLSPAFQFSGIHLQPGSHMLPTYLGCACRHGLGQSCGVGEHLSLTYSVPGIDRWLACKPVVNAWDRLCVSDKCSHVPQLSQAIPAAMSQVGRRYLRTRLIFVGLESCCESGFSAIQNKLQHYISLISSCTCRLPEHIPLSPRY